MGRGLADYRNKLKTKKEEETKNSSSQNTSNGGVGLSKYRNKLRTKELESTINFDTFESDLTNLNIDISDITNQWQSEEDLKKTRSSIESMQKRIGLLQEYRKINGITEGEKEITTLADNFNSVLGEWDNISTEYGKYKSKKEYNDAVAEASQMVHWEEEYGDLTHAELEKTITSEIEKFPKMEDIKNLSPEEKAEFFKEQAALEKKAKWFSEKMKTKDKVLTGSIEDFQKNASTERKINKKRTENKVGDFFVSNGTEFLEKLLLGETRIEKADRELNEEIEKLEAEYVSGFGGEGYAYYDEDGYPVNWGRALYDKIRYDAKGMTLDEIEEYRAEAQNDIDKATKKFLFITLPSGKTTEKKEVYNAIDDAYTVKKAELYKDEKDFEKKSKYIPYEESGKIDDLYDYINGNEGTRKAANSNGAEHMNLPPNFEIFAQMEDSEVAIYNYIYSTKGKDEAQKYLDALETDLNFRDYKAEVTRQDELSGGGLVGENVLSVFRNALDAIPAAASTLGKGITNTPIDTYSHEYKLLNMADITRAETSSRIQENVGGFGGKALDFLYGTTMSTLDTAVTLPLDYVVPGAGMVIMSSRAGVSATNDAIRRGVSQDKAIWTGVLAAGAEAVFEKVEFDKLRGYLKKGRKATAGMVKTILKDGGLTNASQELLTSLSNEMADRFINGDLSNYEITVAKYMNEGLSEEEARRKANTDTAMQLALDAAGGFLQGSGMTAGANAVRGVANISKGKTIKSNDRTSDMVDLAASTPTDSEAHQLYTQYVDKGITAENISSGKVGRLYTTTREEAISTIKDQKSTKEEKSNAISTLNKLREIDTDNKVKKNRDKLNVGEQTEVTESSTPVVVKGINMGEEPTIVTNEGEMSLDSVTLSSRDADLVAYAQTMDEPTANLFIEQYDGQTDVNAYANAFNLVSAYAKNNFDHDIILKNKSVLSSEQATAIYDATLKSQSREENARTEAQQKVLYDITAKHSEAMFVQGVLEDSVIDYNSKTTDGSKVNWNSLSKTQRAAIRFLQLFTKATGVNVRLIKSKVVDGKHDGKNGSYDPDSNTIEIDVFAGRVNADDVKDTIIPTLSHEMTHWMKAKVIKLYREFSEDVLRTQAGLRYTTKEALIEKEIARLKKVHPENATREGAIDEIVARSCADMLTNSNEARKLLNKMTATEQQSFIQKIKETFDNLMQWINDLLAHYKNADATSREAEILREYKAELKRLQKKWDAMFKEAIKTNQALQKEGILGEELINGISKDGTTIVGKNNLQMSERTYADGGRAFLENWLNEQSDLSAEDKKDILSQTDAIAKLMKDIREGNELPEYSRWATMDVAKDENGEKVLSVIVKNGDYAMNIDFSQVCKKRVALNAVLNAMVQSGDLNTFVLTETDVSALNSIIKKHEFEIACALCFVDSKRYRIGGWAESFCEGVDKKKNGKMVHQYGFNEMVRSLIPKGSNIKVDEFNFTNREMVGQPTNNLLSEMDDSELDFTLIDEIMEREYQEGKKPTDLYAYAKAIKDNKEIRKILNPAEIISSIGLDAIRLEQPELYRLINRHQGTAKPKFAHDVVAYGNDILKATNFKPEKAKMVGGVRCQSFSDFMANMVFDYVQFISELSAKELTSHAYTKEPLFVKLFGLTGMKINMSLVPKAIDMTPEQVKQFAILRDDKANKRTKEYRDALREYQKLTDHAGLDENGNYIWEDETFPYDIAMDIVVDPRYSANCGTIAVGISDKHILKLLDDDRISMVIPYHKSGLNHEVAMMRNIALYRDYTTSQNTRFANGKKLEKVPDFNFYEDLYGTNDKEGTHDPKTTADNYLKWCEEHNYIPKFETSTTSNRFKSNPNYYKLLTDFRVYDIDGTYREQQPVKPIYPENEEFKDLILNGVVGKDGTVYGGLKQQQGTADKLTAESQQIIDEFREHLKDKYGKDVLGKQYEDREISPILEDMSDEERYEILKNRIFEKIPKSTSISKDIVDKIPEITQWDDINKYFGNEKRKIIKRLATEFGVFEKLFDNKDIELSFNFSRNNFDESYQKQTKNFETFAKMFSCFDDVIDNAIGIEVHNRNKEGYKVDPTLKNTYVLVSVFEDGSDIYPVKLEVKEFSDKDNSLYVAIALEGIKKEEVLEARDINDVAQASRSSTISISRLLSKINPKDESFLKYIPKQFFDNLQDGAINYSNPQYEDRETESIYDKMGETDRIAEENKKLKADVERLIGVIGDEKVDLRRFRSLADFLKKRTGNDVNREELGDMLKEAYTFIQSGENVEWQDVMVKANEIATFLMNRDLKVPVNYFKEVMSNVRKDTFTLSAEQRAKAEEMFGGYSNFHKAMFGRVNITTNEGGTSLEERWENWSKLYPSIFDANVKGADQIEALANIVDTLKATSSLMGEFEREEAIRHLTNEVYNQFWNIAADSNDAAKKSRAKHREMMEQMRKDYEQRQKERTLHPVGETALKYDALYKKMLKRKKEEISEVKKLGKERLDTYKENAERKTKIQSITSNALTLNKWLTNPDKEKHVNKALRGPVINLLNAIDFSSKQLLGMKGSSNKGTPTKKDISLQGALSEVKDMMADASVGKAELIELYGHGLDDDIKSLVTSVDNMMRTVGDNEFILNQMSLEELETLDKIVRTIKSAVSKMNKFHTVNHAKGIAHLSQEEIEYADSLGKTKVFDPQSLKGKLQKLINWDNKNPFYAFKQFGEAGKKIFEAFQDGWDKLAFNAKRIIDFAKETYSNKEVKEWTKDIKTFDVLIPATNMDLYDPNYKPKKQKVQMTVPQIMSLYCLMKREKAKNHILGGGIRVADIKMKNKELIQQSEGALLTEGDINNIISTLTPRQKAVADALQNFMNTVCAAWGNAVSMARFGYEAFGEENYFPIKSDDNNLQGEETPQEEINSLFKLLNMSFTKNTIQGANNRIVISDIFDVFASHSSDMAKYNALALPVLDANRWYNYTEKIETEEDTQFFTKSVKQSIENAFGKEGKKYITTFLQDINGQKNVGRDTLGKDFFSRAKIVSVAANLRVALLQPTAYLKASAVIDNRYLAQAVLHKPKIDKAIEHCGIALWKSLGYYDTDISRGLTEKIKHDETWKDKVVEFSMKGAEWGDKITFGYLWNACELEIRKTRKDLKVGSEEFYTAIGKRLREVIYATQVVDSTMTRSQLMRSGNMYEKMLTAFSSEPTLAFNMLQDAFVSAKLDSKRYGKAEAWKRNGKNVARVVYAYTITNVVAALIESAFDVLRDDDDEEEENIPKFMQYYLTNFSSDMSIIGKIPYIKEIVSIAQGFSSSRSDTQWMQIFSNVISNAAKISQGKGNPTKLIEDAIRTLSFMSGIPFYNAYRDTMATLNKLDILTAEELEEILSDIFG